MSILDSPGLLIFQDGITLQGTSFGYEGDAAGEVVFSTGMVGYPESLTDPSYAGQILVLTYPLVGNYGVPPESLWESGRIHAAALIVSSYVDTPSHWQIQKTLSTWLKEQNVPALEIKDTRYLAKKLRDEGSQLGKIVVERPKSKAQKSIRQTADKSHNDSHVSFKDPNERNLVAEVSTSEPYVVGEGKKTIVVIDCGVKRNTPRSLAKRGYRVVVVPWDYPLFNEISKSKNQITNQSQNSKFKSQNDLHIDTIDGLLISNGPGDPKHPDILKYTIPTIKEALKRKIPTLGICLGNQLLTLAAGGDTYKLKFGHRSQNQPAILEGTKRCYLTTQNHGFAVGTVPKGFKPWFTNANDGTNEGIIHRSEPFMSTQFHPESCPGPVDTDWVFDYFLSNTQK